MPPPPIVATHRVLSECRGLLRQAGACFLALLLACSGASRVVRPEWNEAVAKADVEEMGPHTAEYELCELPPSLPGFQPVQVGPEEFKRAVLQLARELPFSESPQALAQHLFGVEQEVEFLAQVENGKLVLLRPLHLIRLPPRPLSPAEAELTRQYQAMCSQTRGGGDCLGLLRDGPGVRSDDKYALALAFALDSVLDEVTQGVREQLNVQAVLSMIMGAAVLYMMLWVVPEPVTKLLAATLTVALLAWLTQDTVNSLLKGWEQLVEEADKATTLQQLRESGEHFRQVIGKNTARVLVLAVLTVLGGAGARVAQRLATLPGYTQAALAAEGQGLRLSAAAEVEQVAASAEGGFSVLLRLRRGSGGGAAGRSNSPIATVIRHQAGNRQVVLNNGQRWHVPANKSLRDLPKSDPVGDQLQAAATQAARDWGWRQLSAGERRAIETAMSEGKYWLSRLLYVQARGRWVEDELRRLFSSILKFNRQGVDVSDTRTGYQYEILSGTQRNMAQHGRRMSKSLFRMITF
jgi:hypothetical protein